MQFTTIYKNGKPDYFFIKLDKPQEWAFLQPYFLVTSIDHQRHGRIKEMSCLFSGSVYQGKQYHGYGYSASADVYGELLSIINKLYGSKLTDKTKKELSKINTHDDKLTLSKKALDELSSLNNAYINIKYEV